MLKKVVFLTFIGLFLITFSASAANVYDLTWLTTAGDTEEVYPTVSNNGKKIIWSSYPIYDEWYGVRNDNEIKINYYYKGNTSSWYVRDLINDTLDDYYRYSDDLTQISGDGKTIAFLAQGTSSDSKKLYLMDTKGNIIKSYDFLDEAKDKYGANTVHHTDIVSFEMSNDADQFLVRVKAHSCAAEVAPAGTMYVALDRDKNFTVDLGMSSIAIHGISGKGDVFIYEKEVNSISYLYYAAFPKKASAVVSGIQLGSIDTNFGCYLNKKGTKAVCQDAEKKFYIYTLSGQNKSTTYSIAREMSHPLFLTNDNWVATYDSYEDGVNLVRADGTKLFRVNKKTKGKALCDYLASDKDGDTLICQSYTQKDGFSTNNIYKLKLDKTKLKPKNLKVTNKAGNKARLTWKKVRGAARYKVKVNNKIYTSTKPKMTVTGLTSGTSYDYKVRSIYNSKNKSAWSKTKKLIYN